MIEKKDLEAMQKAFISEPRYRVIQNAVARNDIRRVAMNWDRFATINHTFSHGVQGELPATMQGQSGRCWLFAMLNMLRIPFAKKHKLEEFEFSQSYLFFWDKLEKANHFLTSVIETAAEPEDGRLVMYLFDTLFQDGGQWHMAVSLIEKYGLVPQSVYPDCEASLNSRDFNLIFKAKLREYGIRLRKNPKGKEVMLKEIYRMLCIHFGTPPTTFDCEFRDKDKKVHSHRHLTPQQFYKTHVGVNLHDYVALVHSPRKKTPYHKLFTVKYLGNVVGGDPVVYVNVPIEEMKRATRAMLEAGAPVWFGCDVGKCFNRDLGVMDTALYDLEQIYDLPFSMTKEERMNHGESQMTHAMVFTAVHIVDDKPVRWRVENSWGDKVGKKGYFIMTDAWFDEYMFEVAIHKKHLPKKVLEVLKQPAIVLDPWDPLGSLATDGVSSRC